jgi:hypothetical protein
MIQIKIELDLLIDSTLLSVGGSMRIDWSHHTRNFVSLGSLGSWRLLEIFLYCIVYVGRNHGITRR